MAEIDADLAQRLVVFAAGVAAKNKFGIGGAMQPAVLLDFLLELPGRPAGITERQDRRLRSAAMRDGFQYIQRCGQADAVVDRQRRILDEEIGRMQNEAAAGFHRAAFEYLDLVGGGRQLNPLGRRVSPCKKFGDRRLS